MKVRSCLFALNVFETKYSANYLLHFFYFTFLFYNIAYKTVSIYYRSFRANGVRRNGECYSLPLVPGGRGRRLISHQLKWVENEVGAARRGIGGLKVTSWAYFLVNGSPSGTAAILFSQGNAELVSGHEPRTFKQTSSTAKEYRNRNTPEHHAYCNMFTPTHSVPYVPELFGQNLSKTNSGIVLLLHDIRRNSLVC